VQELLSTYQVEPKKTQDSDEFDEWVSRSVLVRPMAQMAH